MISPDIHQSFTVDGVEQCCLIACVASVSVWVSVGQKIILTNTKEGTLKKLNDRGWLFYNSPFLFSTEEQKCARFGYGLHTVNSESSLIYIDGIGHINILSKNMKTKTLYVERTDFKWVIRCLHWSPITRDVLVGMFDTMTGKVVRYNQAGQQTQTIEKNNEGHYIYVDPNYVTENNNGDVLVADFDNELCALVVTDFRGRYRFSYIGPPSGPRLEPQGVCTDALSHIIVCDVGTNTIQILDSDGLFLSYLLIRPSGILSQSA